MGWQPCGGCAGTSHACNSACAFSSTPSDPDPAIAVIHDLLASDVPLDCGDCATVFDGSNLLLPFIDTGAGARCVWSLIHVVDWCDPPDVETGFEGVHFLLARGDGSTYQPTTTVAFQVRSVNSGGGELALAVYTCPLSSFSCDLGAVNTFVLTALSGAGFCVFPSTITQSWA